MNNDDFIKELSTKVVKLTPLASPLVRFTKWFIFGLIIVSLSIAFMGIRHDFSEVISSARFIFETVLLILIVITSSISAFYIAIPGEERKINKLFMSVPFVLWGVELIGVLLWDIFTSKTSVQITPGWMCSSNIVLLAIPAALLIIFMIQKASPTMPKWTGWFSLIGALSLSALTEQFTCHNGSAIHLLIWHFLPVLCVGGLGWFFARKIFKL